jgi:hypothetical protein
VLFERDGSHDVTFPFGLRFVASRAQSGKRQSGKRPARQHDVFFSLSFHQVFVLSAWVHGLSA